MRRTLPAPSAEGFSRPSQKYMYEPQFLAHTVTVAVMFFHQSAQDPDPPGPCFYENEHNSTVDTVCFFRTETVSSVHGTSQTAFRHW